jgi:hypothetical protein
MSGNVYCSQCRFCERVNSFLDRTKSKIDFQESEKIPDNPKCMTEPIVKNIPATPIYPERSEVASYHFCKIRNAAYNCPLYEPILRKRSGDVPIGDIAITNIIKK